MFMAKASSRNRRHCEGESVSVIEVTMDLEREHNNVACARAFRNDAQGASLGGADVNGCPSVSGYTSRGARHEVRLLSQLIPYGVYWPMVLQWALPMATQTARGVAAMPQRTLVLFPSGRVRMIRSVRGSIFVREFPSAPVVQTAPAPTARESGCSAERSRRLRVRSVCGSILISVGPGRPDAHG
jgi:hypothetical protein